MQAWTLYFIALIHYAAQMTGWAIQCAGIYTVAYTPFMAGLISPLANWWLLSKIHHGAKTIKRYE